VSRTKSVRLSIEPSRTVSFLIGLRGKSSILFADARVNDCQNCVRKDTLTDRSTPRWSCPSFGCSDFAFLTSAEKRSFVVLTQQIREPGV
jgi:hypothetical protein